MSAPVNLPRTCPGCGFALWKEKVPEGALTYPCPACGLHIVVGKNHLRCRCGVLCADPETLQAHRKFCLLGHGSGMA